MSGWASSDRRDRLPRDWPRRRAKVKRRAGGICECHGICGRDHKGRCPVPGTDCDHVIPNDDHSLGNLQWLCSDCHKRKTIIERQAAKQPRKRPPTRHPGLI